MLEGSTNILLVNNFFIILNQPMFEKNPLTLALIVVIIVLAFMLYCGSDSNLLLSKFKVNKKEKFEEKQASDKNTNQADSSAPINMDLNPEFKTKQGDDKYQNILMESLVKGISRTGITSSDNVNSGLELGDTNDI